MEEEIIGKSNTIIKGIFDNATYPWEVIPKIKDYIISLGQTLDKEEYDYLEGNIWISKSATIDPKSTIIGPCIICAHASIGPNAYLRENVFIGEYTKEGSSEIKNSIILNNCQIPHFNYVGDSLLGEYTHLGAGVILSNLRNDKQNIKINNIDTNLRKLGAIIYGRCDIGCNSVVFPGTIIYPNVSVYPLTRVRKIISRGSIVK